MHRNNSVKHYRYEQKYVDIEEEEKKENNEIGGGASGIKKESNNQTLIWKFPCSKEKDGIR